MKMWSGFYQFPVKFTLFILCTNRMFMRISISCFFFQGNHIKNLCEIPKTRNLSKMINMKHHFGILFLFITVRARICHMFIWIFSIWYTKRTKMKKWIFGDIIRRHCLLVYVHLHLFCFVYENGRISQNRIIMACFGICYYTHPVKIL